MKAGSEAAADRTGFGRVVDQIDGALEVLTRIFLIAANLCLLAMLAGMAAIIVLRPLGISFYWIWPWSMQVFVWMSFIGFFVVYRRGKDIAVDFVVKKMGDRAMRVSRIFVALVMLGVVGVMLSEMPTIFESQVGVIDGVITPWGTELERYSLSIPLAVSCVLIFINTLLELAKIWLGRPEQVVAHVIADE